MPKTSELFPIASASIAKETDPIAMVKIAEIENRLKTIEGDRVAVVSGVTIEAGVWTQFPTPAIAGTIKDFKIFDATGSDITFSLEARRSISGWEVFSLTKQENLTFEYELAPATGEPRIEKTVLALLPANTWTNLPAATGAILDYKIFDLEQEVTTLLESRKVNGVYQLHSLIDLVNLQIECEIGVLP